jgi:hypothetical protein
LFTIGTLEVNAPHLLADIVELLAISRWDGRAAYSMADLESLLVADTTQSPPGTLNADLREAWRHLAYRKGRFDGAYPFLINPKNNALRLKPRLTQEARIYRFLLACSRLKSFDNKLRQSWATGFTLVSREALAALLPFGASVRIFDANSDDRRKYYGTNLHRALEKLSVDLAANMINGEEIAKLSTSGDRGIDLVACVNFNDSASGCHAVLGQCAARQTEWPTKTFEAHPDRLRGVFSLLVDPSNVVFIPLLYRDTNGMWISNSEVSGCLAIDRWRIVHLLRESGRVSTVANQTWFKTFEMKFEAAAVPRTAKAA